LTRGLASANRVCERPREEHGWGPRASARGNLQRKGNRRARRARLRPSRKREGKPAKKETGEHGGHGWGPRASARGNQRKKREGRPGLFMRRTEARFLSRILFPGFPPGLGRGLPSWGGSFCPLFSAQLLETWPNANRFSEQPGEEHGWGPRASARGNQRKKREGRPGLFMRHT